MSHLDINPYTVTHDELTGLPNKFLFYDRLNTTIATAERSTNRFATLYIKFNDLRLVSNKYEKSIADALLLRISKRLGDSLRVADSMGRLDDCEFGVIISHVMDKRVLDSLVYRVYKMLVVPYKVNSHSISIHPSIGMSVYPDHGMNAISLINYAATHGMNYE